MNEAATGAPGIDLKNPPAPYQPVADVDPDDFITFWEFFRDVYVPQKRPELVLQWQHKDICDNLEAAFLGLLPEGIEFVLVEMPPRTGKTTIARAFVAWAAAYFPESQWILTGYAGPLAEESLAEIANILREPWFVDLFGDHLHARKADHATTIEGGNFYAEGVDGSLTGKGAGQKRPAGGCIIVDDPMKPSAVFSPVQAEGVRRWFETTLKNRRNSDRWTPIILIAQALGIGDLGDYIAKTYPKQTLVLRYSAHVDPKTGKASEADDAISAFPDTVSTETLHAYKATRTGRFVRASQYQQARAAFGGNLIVTDDFHRFDPREFLRYERLVITVDTALKAKQSSNHSVLELWGKFGTNAYLQDLSRGKWESPELLENTVTFWNKCVAWAEANQLPRPELIIEEKAAGPGLIQQLRRLGIPVKGIERAIDKVQRVQSILPYVENGFVFVPRDGTVPWIDAFITECANFQADGTSPDDDQVDCFVDGVEQLLGKVVSILDVLRKKTAEKFTAPDVDPKAILVSPAQRAELEAHAAYLKRTVGPGGKIRPMQA